MASQNPHELDKDRTCTRCSQPFHSTAVTRDTMWPEPTINVTQRHLFCELKDLFWPPVLTEPWLQFEVLCCSSLTLRQPVSLYGICSSDKLMQECTWVCVVKNSPQIFFYFFIFVRMADGVYKCILPVGVRVCVRVDLHAFPLCMLSKQFLLSANRRHFSRNFILVPVRTESFYIGSGHLIIKKVNTQHSHVTRKRNVPWMIFLFLFFPSRPCQRVFPI